MFDFINELDDQFANRLRSGVQQLQSGFTNFTRQTSQDIQQKRQQLDSMISSAKLQAGAKRSGINLRFQKFLEDTEPERREIQLGVMQAKNNPIKIGSTEVQQQLGNITSGFNNFLKQQRDSKIQQNEQLAKSTLPLAMDFTVRPLMRLGARGAVSLADEFGKHVPGYQQINSIKAETPWQKFLLGDDPIYTFQKQQRETTNWLADKGMDPRDAHRLAYGIILGANAMDADLGLLPGPSQVDDIAEVAVKKLGKKNLDNTMEYLFQGKNILVRNFNMKPQQADLVTKKQYLELMKQPETARLKYITEKIIPEIEQTTANIFRGVRDDIAENFGNWVNARRSVDLSAWSIRNKFSDLGGISDFFKIQSGEAIGAKYEKLRNFFDKKHTALVKQGLLDVKQFRTNYLPQMWVRPDDNKLADVYEKVIKTNGSWSWEAAIKSYEEGIALGLTPRFKTVSDLAAYYDLTTSRVVADKKFFDFLKAQEMIAPAKDAPKHWVTVKAEGFPKFKSKDGEDLVTKAPPELAKIIDNYMIHPEGTLQNIAGFASRAKNIALSSGVPGTGVNYFGFTQYARNLLTASNPLSRMLKTTDWWFQPNHARSFLEENLTDAKRFSKAGLTLSGEDFNLEPVAKEVTGNLAIKSLKQVGNKFEEWLSDPLFKKILPAVKLNNAQELEQILIKSGLDPDEALKIAVRDTNNIFGGINLDALARNKQTQDILRSLTLAPDFMESLWKTGKGLARTARHPLDPNNRQYLIFASNFMTGYLVFNLINYARSGKMMAENGRGHQFDIDSGMYDSNGKKIWIRPWAGAVDMIRIPFEIAYGLATGDLSALQNTARGRLSMPVGAGVGLLSNTDYRGDRLVGKDRYGNPIPVQEQIANVAGEALSGVGVPSQFRTGLKAISGQYSPLQAGTELMELPIRYSGGAYGEKEQDQLNRLQQSGMSNQDIGEFFESKEQKSNFFDTLLRGLGFKESIQGNYSDDALVMAVQMELNKDKEHREILEVFKSGGSQAEVKEKLDALGYKYEDAVVEVAKGLGVSNGARPSFILSVIQNKSGAERSSALAYLADKSIFTSSVVDYWLDKSLITDAQAEAMKKLVKQVTAKKSTSGSSKKVSMPKINLNIPDYEAPQVQIEAPSLGQRLFVQPPKLSERQGGIRGGQMPTAPKFQQMPAPQFSRIPR